MDFIRRQRQQPDYVPCRHAFYGPVRIDLTSLGTSELAALRMCSILIHVAPLQDADLIMLALATHEPDFRIIREDPKDKRDQRCGRCFEFGHSDKVCQSEFTEPTRRSFVDHV